MTTKDIFGVYPFQVGGQEAWALHDGFLWGEPVQQYAIDVSDAEIAALFEPNFLNPQRIQLGMSPILFRWGSELVLTDTGIGSIVGDPIGGLGQRLSALGVEPQEISAVLLTHLHVDHIGGSLDRANKKSLFPRARIFISEVEIEFWRAPSPDISELRMYLPSWSISRFTVRMTSSKFWPNKSNHLLRIRNSCQGFEVFPCQATHPVKAATFSSLQIRNSR